MTALVALASGALAVDYSASNLLAIHGKGADVWAVGANGVILKHAP